MKRAQVAALVAGAALGLAAVAAATVVLSRKENREAALRMAQRSAELGAQGTKRASEWATAQSKVASDWAAQGGKIAGDWADQARKLGTDLAKQYQEQAPKAVESLANALPRLGAGKKDSATVQA